MEWRKYEDQIYRHLSSQFPSCEISSDRRVTGRYSGLERQIDILLSGNILDYPIRGVVDCKYFSKNLDVGAVDQFCGYMADVEAQIGVLVVNSGFSEEAGKRAKNDPQSIYLHVVPFEDFDNWQFDRMSLIVPALASEVQKFKRKATGHTNLLPRELASYLDMKSPMFKQIMDEQLPWYREILIRLCKEPFFMTRQNLVDEFKIASGRMATALARLLEDGVIQKEFDLYKIRDPFFVLWTIARLTDSTVDTIDVVGCYLKSLSSFSNYRDTGYMQNLRLLGAGTHNNANSADFATLAG